MVPTAKDRKEPLDIIIVGGSLGGLAAGLALKAIGQNVTIMERNPTPLLQNQGAGIVAGGDTLDFFKRYDRCQRPIAVSSQRRQYFDKSGNIVHKEDMVQNMTSWDLAYYLMRANYDGIESDYTVVPKPAPGEGKAVHLHGHKVTDVKEDGDKVRVFFQKEKEEGSMVADLCVAADGPSSTIRTLLAPDVKRTYVGYCALRGTVPENEGTDRAKEAFQERFSFFHGPGRQILAYLIPGVNGSIKPGERLINFVYYTNFPEGPELDEILTDRDGVRHRITMPPGKTDPKAWEKQKKLARENLPPQFADIVCGTKQPFVQAITDVISPKNEYLNGKVVLIGDSLAGFRPHTVASTSQAAFDAMVLADMIEGKITHEEWRTETMAFARLIQNRGVHMGNRSQFGDLPLSEHIHDRNVASTPRQQEVWPEWVKV